MTGDYRFIAASNLFSLFRMTGKKCWAGVRTLPGCFISWNAMPKHASVLVLALFFAIVLNTVPANAQDFVFAFGSFGSRPGQFNTPLGIAVGSDFYWVADTNNNRIQEIFVEIPKIDVRKVVGSFGSGDGQFMLPNDVAAGFGFVWVADTENNRIQQFDSQNGTFVRMWGWGVRDGANEFQICERSCRAGIGGPGQGQFRDPISLALPFFASTEQEVVLFVLDAGNSRIQKFDIDGNFLGEFGKAGNGEGEFMDPMGLVVLGAGEEILIADTGNNRIQVVDQDGKFLSQFGEPGNGDGEFNSPSGVAFDNDDNLLFVSDSGNERIQVFDFDGVTARFSAKFGSSGSGNGEFNNPTDIAFDFSADGLLVVDTNNNRIQIFATDAGAPGSGVGGGGGGGCSIAPKGSHTLILLALFLVLPVFILARRLRARDRT